MTTKETLMEQVVTLLRERSKESLRIAEQLIKQRRIDSKPLRAALDYFMEETFKDISQPGLLSLYCEAVGGKPEETTLVGAALVLFVSSADLHDDVIDDSEIKNQKSTVLGKFGKDLAILAGDALLIEGIFALHRAIADFSLEKKNAILEAVDQAFFGLSSAEIEEVTHRGKNDLTAEEYLQIIKKKTAVSEATGRIGAILANGTLNDLETMSHIGRVLGLLNTLRDEFIDVYEATELENRFRNEVLPLPVLYAFRDPAQREKIISLLQERNLSDESAEKILRIVMASPETDVLRQIMKAEIQSTSCCLLSLKEATQMLKLLLEASLDDIQSEAFKNENLGT